MVYEMHPSRTDVRFTPESGHVQCTSSCLLSANSGQTVLLRGQKRKRCLLKSHDTVCFV